MAFEKYSNLMSNYPGGRPSEEEWMSQRGEESEDVWRSYWENWEEEPKVRLAYENPEPFNFPDVPAGVYDLGYGLHAQTAVENVWRTYHRTPEYRNPEYTAWEEQYGQEPGFEPAPHSGYTQWSEPSAIERHLREVVGFTEEQISNIMGIYGFRDSDGDNGDTPGVPAGAYPWPDPEYGGQWYVNPNWAGGEAEVFWHPEHGYVTGDVLNYIRHGQPIEHLGSPEDYWSSQYYRGGQPSLGDDVVTQPVPTPTPTPAPTPTVSTPTPTTPTGGTETPYWNPDDWEYTQRWGTNPPPSQEWQELEKGEPYTFQPFVPKTQPPTGIGFKPSQYEAGGVPGYLQEWLTQLEQPIEAQIGLTDRERQSIYNLGRGQIQGATRTAAEQMRETLGDKGFRVGETGFADTPISQIYKTGQTQLAEFGKEISISEAQRRFEQQQAIAQMNLNRVLGAGGLATSMAGIEAQERMAGRQLTSQERMFGTGLEWEQAQYAQELQWQQEMFGEQMRWEQERFGRELTQEERLAQQLISWEQQKYGTQLEWEKYRFGEQFGYLQERDVMEDLFNYLGLATQSQLARYEPYWQSWLNVV